MRSACAGCSGADRGVCCGRSERMREQFETNFFGLVDVTTAVLPHMRARRAGTVVMIGSRSVWKNNIPVSAAAGCPTRPLAQRTWLLSRQGLGKSNYASFSGCGNVR